LKEIFAETGIEVTSDNREQLDQAVHRIMETEYKDCPATWSKIKKEILADERKRKDFINSLKSAVA
jgi:molecular chaperone GrpE (heat shock protein)